MDIRRTVLLAVLVGLTTTAAYAESPISVAAATPASPVVPKESASGVHDFDFLMGHWTVHHRKLQTRLANKNDWMEFEGTLYAQKLMNGYGNVDDNTFDAPTGAYRGVGLRSYDAKNGVWSIWWLDSRFPLGSIEPPVRGRFANGVGTFYADDIFESKPIRMRYIWSNITANTARWEQAFSLDAGKTWETNWVMDFRRVPE